MIERKVVAETDGKRLERLWVQVDKARHAPVSFRGVPFERVLNTTRVMLRTAYQRLLLESLHGTARWATVARFPATEVAGGPLQVHRPKRVC